MTSPSLLNASKTQKHDDLHLWLRGDNVMTVIDAITKDWDLLDDRKWTELSKISEYDGEVKSEAKSYRYRKLAWQPILDKIEREVPVYSHNYKSNYLQGICDSVILYHIEITAIEETYKMIKKYDENDIHVKLKERMRIYEADKNSDYYKKYPEFFSRKNPTRESVIEKDNPKFIWENVGRLRHRHQTEKWISSSIESGYIVGKDDWHNRDNQYNQYRILTDFKPKLTSISGIMGQLKVYKNCIGPSDLMIITYDKNEKYDAILKDENIHIMRIEEQE